MNEIIKDLERLSAYTKEKGFEEDIDFFIQKLIKTYQGKEKEVDKQIENSELEAVEKQAEEIKKEEVKDEIEERLSKGCDEPTSFNKCGKKYTDGKVYYCEFCLGRIKQHKETKQKIIEEFKEMIDKKLEGFKKVRQGIIGNTKVLTAYNCFIAHLEELKSQMSNHSSPLIKEDEKPKTGEKSPVHAKIHMLQGDIHIFKKKNKFGSKLYKGG